MHNFVNLYNICEIGDFGPSPCDPSLVVPSISELVMQARQTGQMPYGNQRVPIPSYTDNLDDDIPYNSPDKVGAALNESFMRSRIQDLEKDFEGQKSKIDVQKFDDKPSETPPPSVSE